ncbi:MAG TPA: molybdopterin molybdenumtransferase MoeA [Gammaproteobacteria bacterium]|nr:molybdopterin molybdenumtransferase MoeA [Gammaproteobacteria bacterium]
MTTAHQDCCADAHDHNLTPAQARHHILDAINPLTTLERLALREGLDRVLGAAMVSPVNVPSHTNSAMDGYALAATDLPSQDHVDLVMVGTALAGLPFSGRCEQGQCVRIMTGACLPEGTDTVVIQERVERLADGRIRIGAGGHSGQNIRQAGEDIKTGDIVLSPGQRLTAADIGIIASLGIGEIDVIRRPRVAFFSTGDELRSIGQSLRDGDVYDSNRYSLYSMLKRLNVDLLDLGVVADQPELLRKVLLDAAATCDVVITSGGVSVGDADYIKPLLQEMGTMSFWKIAMKPGRPLVFGHLDKAAFFGLPGNPVAVMVTFYQFVLPALLRLSGQHPQAAFTFTARSRHAIRKRAGRCEFQRGILQSTGHGQWQVTSAGHQGSGILTSMSRANCFILLDETCDGIKPGDLVEVQPFAGLI